LIRRATLKSIRRLPALPEAFRLHEQRRKLQALKVVVIVGLLVATTVAPGFYWLDVHGRH
jgi:hypothetical protein